MPKQKHFGPYLIKRKPRSVGGKLTHRGTYVIKDPIRGTSLNTGIGLDDGAAAERRLAEYIVSLHLEEKILEVGNKFANEVLLGDVLALWLTKRTKKLERMSAPKRRETLSQIERLNEYWGHRYASDIVEDISAGYIGNEETGRPFMKQSVARNDMILFRSIVLWACRNGKIKKFEDQFDFQVPPPLDPRIEHFEFAEVKALYKAAMRRRHTFKGKPCQRVATHIAPFILVAVMTGTRASRICNASFVKEEGRPWIDLENGIFYRAAKGERVAKNKRAGAVRIPPMLLKAMRRWHRGTLTSKPTKYLIEFNGKPVDCRKGFYTLKNDVFDKERAGEVNRHTFKHTCVTWLLQNDVSVEAVANYVSTTPEVIRKHYAQWIPGENDKIMETFGGKKPKKSQLFQPKMEEEDEFA
jgi:integrase